MTSPTPVPPWLEAPPTVARATRGARAEMLDPTVERRLVSEQLFHGVLTATPRTLALGLLAALTLATVATWGTSDTAAHARHQRQVWGWVALVALVLAHGLHTARLQRKWDPAVPVALRLARRYTCGAHACAVLWGLAGWVLIPAPQPWATAVILVGMSMVLLGAATAMAGCRRIVTVHLSLIAVVFSTGLMRTLQPEHVVSGLGFVLLAAAAIGSAHRQEAALSRAIASQLRIASLLERLQREQSASDAARQDAITAREEADRAHTAKAVFMAAASHDLRQPMHALTQYLAAIARLNDDPKLRASIAGAHEAVDTMGHLLQAVLEINQLMSGAVVPQPEVFALDDWSRRRLRHFEPLAAAKGLVLNVAAPELLLVCTDRLLLDRVLGNLVHNAIRYTDQGQVSVRVSRQGAWARIRVADTGRGIARAARQRVFEPFYQVANPGRNRQFGLGLGLAVVQEQVKLLGLRLRLTSRLGRGSVFTVTLPLSPERRGVARSDVPMGDPASRRQRFADALIVLIDDDDMSLRATEATLVAFGARVIVGHDAEEAVRALRGQHRCPQLILSDYRLDHATGLEAVALVQQHCRAAFGHEPAPAVVILSGETSPAELAKVHASGAQMLHKPVRPAVLFRQLHAALNRRGIKAA